MSTDSTMQIVVFSLGEEEYALPITQVHEIIRFTEPRSVASSDPSVRGVISLRGKILPVYDLATRLGVEHADVSEAKIVIVETAEDMAGVVVDDVEEVITIPVIVVFTLLVIQFALIWNARHTAQAAAQLFRCGRCVVDTGIHHMRWSKEKAIAYLERYVQSVPPRAQRHK